MSIRGSGMTRESLDETLAGLQEQDNLSDDDNAQPEFQEQEMEVEDPLFLAIDDLEGRIVTALDEVQVHPGVRTLSTPGAPSAHEELASMLRQVLEVAAHTGPSIARTYYRGEGNEGLEQSVEDVYSRVVSDLVLPVMLEMAQSERIPAKLGASLEFFHNLWSECNKAGSWLDSTSVGPQAGPYGAGGSHSSSAVSNPSIQPLLLRRQAKRLARESEILRYWVQASIACMEPGVLTSDEGEGVVASRGVIAACASLRPSLRHIAQRIKDTDDRGANRLYGPVMRMVEGVFKKLFLGNPSESIRSACIKFLEIAILCFSFKPKDSSSRRRGQTTGSDFSLEDIPAGHPIITREGLESVAEYAFTALRGLTLLGGQIKIDANILSDVLMSSSSGGSPSTQVVSILKPAALAYLEVESNLPKAEGEGSALKYTLDRSAIEFDFRLSQKSYTLSINAVQALAVNRPVFFREAAICIARRSVQPPTEAEGGTFSKSAILAITSQLKATCLTLLRNSLSVTSNSNCVLHGALQKFDMEIQADKALSMAKQATALKTAGRAARNRANMYYEWDASDNDRVSRRQKETDDALKQMRAAKAARGLGHGIQLPSSMSDSIDLIVMNLKHLPPQKPQATSTKAGRVPTSLDYIVDAIVSNGASLSQEEGNWYERDGSSAWSIKLDSQDKYVLKENFIESLRLSFQAVHSKEMDEREFKRRKIILEQCDTAATSALSRILAATTNTTSKTLGALSSMISSRLSFVLNNTRSFLQQEETLKMVSSCIERLEDNIDDKLAVLSLKSFVDKQPLVAASLVSDMIATPASESQKHCTSKTILNEAFLQSCAEGGVGDSFWIYDNALALYVSLVVHAGVMANENPTDMERKKAANEAAAKLEEIFLSLPRLTEFSVTLLARMSDLENISKRVAVTQGQSTQESIAVASAGHAAKQAAERRAKVALVLLRDICFEKDSSPIRLSATRCALGIASGRLPSSPKVQERALALVVNVLFTKNDRVSALVVKAAKEEIKLASDKAIEAYDEIDKANKQSTAGKTNASAKKNPLAPKSPEEKQHLDRMRGPAVLYMAFCLRLPELIKDLFEMSSREKADVLTKAVRINIGKLAKASSVKHGKTHIALKVAGITGPNEIPLLLTFLEQLAAPADRNNPDQEIIEVCYKIQTMKKTEDGEDDPRFLVPVLPYMLRKEIGSKLSQFVAAGDRILLTALSKMGERLSVQALLFREEQDEEIPSLRGLTLCEQLVFLHKLDFTASSLPQKRYLAAIKMCLEDEEVYSDQVVMSALDYISGSFLTRSEKLPLAFMRTCILVCSQHESLHSWICHELLPRLIDGKVYEDARQWEGWMRCAHMLENSGSEAAISKLPPEQLMQYRTKWASNAV